MLPLIFEMKILKYTFKLPNLTVVDDELVEDGVIEETHTFTLLFKGIGVYEELAHKPLLASLLKFKNDGGVQEEALDNMLSREFISNLACASYIKIENNNFHNNRSTAEEFKKTKAYSSIFSDLKFIEALITMAGECIVEDQKAKIKSDVNNNSKN